MKSECITLFLALAISACSGCSTGRICGRSRFSISSVSANGNDQTTVTAEVNSPEFRSAVAQAASIGEWRIKRLRITFTSDDLTRYSFSPCVSDSVAEVISAYITFRSEGHSAAYCNEVLKLIGHGHLSDIADEDLRAIAAREPLLPISWLNKVESGTRTNNAGQLVSRTITTSVVDGKTVTNEVAHIPEKDEICRWTLYNVIDGDLAWRYFVQFKSDGTIDYVSKGKFDSIEVDPRYQEVLDEVEAEVTAEMKRDGSYGLFGSVHGFWRLKKQKLKAIGIDWKSPSELNPNIHYD